MRIVSEDADLLVVEATWTPGVRTPPHVHPEMEERFTVLAGEAAFVVGGERRTARAGETVAAAPGAVHEAWATGAEPARVRLEFRPPLRWAQLVRRTIAGEDPVVVAREFGREVRPARRAASRG